MTESESKSKLTNPTWCKCGLLLPTPGNEPPPSGLTDLGGSTLTGCGLVLRIMAFASINRASELVDDTLGTRVPLLPSFIFSWRCELSRRGWLS